jgi:hypothetical protein
MRASPPDISIRVAYGSLVVGIAVLGLKGYAAHVTGSIALFSDALESVVNVVTAIVALVAVRLAARPADAALPYGYHKAEYFSAVVIGIFIAVAALVIFSEAWNGFFAPRPFEADPIGIGVSVVATLLNAGWAWFLIRTGRSTARRRWRPTGGISPRTWYRPRACWPGCCWRWRQASPSSTRSCRLCRCHHPLVGLAADPAERGGADGRGGGAADAQPDPRDHFGQCRGRHRSP